jgi:hypothetical protein
LHRLEPDTARRERLAQLQRRKVLRHARTENHQLRSQREQRIGMGDRQVRKHRRAPMREQLIGRHEAAPLDTHLPDADLGVRVTADQIDAGASFEGELHDRVTIPPVRELVIVLTDLYLPAAQVEVPAGAQAVLPGIEHAGRYGERVALTEGWRTWLARRLGRDDLAALAPARIAATVLPATSEAQWLATPVHLSAGLSRVHLDHRGLLRLSAAEQASLTRAFANAFVGSGFSLAGLPCGEFVLQAPGIPPVPTTEPARCAGGEIAAALPHGVEAAALRRVAAEIEMWLHGEETNAVRTRLGRLSVNALWLWGGAAASPAPVPRALLPAPLGFGSDAYLDGLWHLHGGSCRPLPQELAGVLAPAVGACTVLALSVAAELQQSLHASFAQALGALDERFIAPALAALGDGALASVTLVGNDTALTVRRRSALRIWRRGRPGLASLRWA